MIPFLIRRFRWMFAGAAGRWVLKRVTDRSVESATEELAERLPNKVVKAADALPGDVMRAGGATLAAGRVAAKGIGAASERAKGKAERNARQAKAEITTETERQRRSLWSDFLRFTGRPDEATDALLDLRQTKVDPKAEPGAAFQNVPGAVAAGRKIIANVMPKSVNRNQRTYKPKPKAWD